SSAQPSASGVATQVPPWQASPVVQLLPSLQVVPAGWWASAGQVLETPSQLSATSQTPVAARQTAVLFWSAGQSLPTPSQLSGTSQGPAAARQTVELLASAGQLGPVPGQFSAGSHAPAAARHTTVAGWKASVGQLAFVPSQVSSASHGPADARHRAPGLPAGCWQISLDPLQASLVHGFPSSVHGVPAATF